MRNIVTTGTTPQDHQTAQTPSAVVGLDGVAMTVKRPKTAVLLDYATIEAAAPLEQVRLVQNFLNDVLDGPSRTHLALRLRDPDDDLDISSPGFLAFIEAAFEELGLGPTVPSSGSPTPPASPGLVSPETLVSPVPATP